MPGDPGAGWVGGHASKVDMSSGDVDEEQHVDPFEEDGVDGEEVAGQDAAGLGGEELLPGWAGAVGPWVDAGAVQDVPSGAGRDLVAEADQFAVDTSVPPGRVVCGQSQHQVPDLAGGGRPAGPSAPRG
jgi:hypothetical protein